MKEKSQKQQIEQLSELDLLKYADKYTSVSDIITKEVGFASSGSNGAIITRKMKEWGINWLNSNKNTKYIDIKKNCPICNTIFITKNNKNEKTTCSYACANTFFRSGKNNPNWKGNNYRIICFNYHKKRMCNLW